MSWESAYAGLVRAYRDWYLTNDAEALQRIAANKDTLMQRCGGMTPTYLAFVELAQLRGEEEAAVTRS